MSRRVAAALTAVIFAAIAFCFLHPTPDMVEAERCVDFDGSEIEMILYGDAEYFVGDVLCSFNPHPNLPHIYITLIVAKPYHLLLGEQDQYWYGGGFTDYGLFGKIDKLVNGRWQYYCPSGAFYGRLADLSEPARAFMLNCDRSKKEAVQDIHSHILTYAPILDDAGEYRLTLYFREMAFVRTYYTDATPYHVVDNWVQQEEVHSVCLYFKTGAPS